MKQFLVVLTYAVFLGAFSGEAHAVHQTQPSETQKSDSPSVSLQVKQPQGAQSDTVEALINVLDRKGLVTREEIRKELEKMREQR